MCTMQHSGTSSFLINSHMTVTSPIQKWMKVADIVRRLVIFMYEKENFTLMWSGILSLRKLLQSAMHWQNGLFLTLESLTFQLLFHLLLCYLQAKIHAVTSLEGAHGITWYKQKKHQIGECQNRCQLSLDNC